MRFMQNVWQRNNQRTALWLSAGQRIFHKTSIKRVSSQEQTGQLEKEKTTPEEITADGFVGNRLPVVCGSH
ncbi:hypothetical protein Bpfe_003352 [Biomphalaria pfeifferi]|uniref:Uncharacterized protein n=1 Tax=Biomphalaria pfeifferi TaxID=112525 RepID=A0AAD8C7Y7_BIOPF|nr:hypothetical protein Bpfe_003352 [Biomphalaria pfeifferi]